MSDLCRRQDVQAVLVALRLQAILMLSQGPELASSAFPSGNGLLPSIASDLMYDTPTISHIFSKIEAFLYIGPQLVIRSLQAFGMAL